MSVVGFDVGNDTSCVALARKRGIDVIMNKESKRETPAAINFGKFILMINRFQIQRCSLLVAENPLVLGGSHDLDASSDGLEYPAVHGVHDAR